VVGLFSYNGGLFWGFTADWETVPDLHDFVVAVEDSFRELQDAAARLSAPPPRRPRAVRPRRQRAVRPRRAKRRASAATE